MTSIEPIRGSSVGAGVVQMVIAVFWTVVGTLLLVGVVSSVAGRRRRRQQLARLYETPGSVDAARAAAQFETEHRAWTFGK